MRLLRVLLFLIGAAAAVAVARHGLRSVGGHRAPGGILVGDAGGYDAFSRRMLGSFFDRIADDVAEAASNGARVLEVGCGPGHLSIQLARRQGLVVTGVDLDPAMVERAQVNAVGIDGIDGRRPSFQVGDVAHLAFADDTFDLVVSTLSMHHWADPSAGLSEIGRVLRPSGRALIWDFRPGIWPLHRQVPDPAEHVQDTHLRIVQATPWRWPWKLRLTQRIELVRPEAPTRPPQTTTGETSSNGESHG